MWPPEDFTNPLYHRVAKLLYQQYEEGDPNPAKILDYFEDEEEQKAVAAVFHAGIPLDSDAEKNKALFDVVCRLKEDSIAHRNAAQDPSDIKGLMQIIQEKKELENLKAGRSVLHISFD